MNPQPYIAFQIFKSQYLNIGVVQDDDLILNGILAGECEQDQTMAITPSEGVDLTVCQGLDPIFQAMCEFDVAITNDTQFGGIHLQAQAFKDDVIDNILPQVYVQQLEASFAPTVSPTMEENQNNNPASGIQDWMIAVGGVLGGILLLLLVSYFVRSYCSGKAKQTTTTTDEVSPFTSKGEPIVHQHDERTGNFAYSRQ